MTSTGRDALGSLLFASGDCQLVNVKLMRGDSQDISIHDLREQVHSALMQVRTETAITCVDFPDAADHLHLNLEELAVTI